MTSDATLPTQTQQVQAHVQAAGLTADIRHLPDSAHTAREAAEALGCPLGAIASSLLFVVDGEPTLVMTSGRHRVDTDALGTLLGAGRVKLSSPVQVEQLTGQAIGGVAPTGHPQRLRTIVDVALRDYDVIWTAAGTTHTVMSMGFSDLLRLTGGTVATVSPG